MAEEGSLPIGGSTVSELQSQEQAGLLDAIDQLRRANIDADIGIPQVVVCGDQSSGKSSLLEAIAQVPFPVGSGAVTMFATELVLRHSSSNAVYASLLPSSHRPTEQKNIISEFNFRPKKLDRDEFTQLYAAASVFLEEVDRGPGFRYDTLRIEVSGPTQPHLTLIDLPGLIRTATGAQSSETVEAVAALTRSYLQKPRTIVLAVVNATSDFQVQSIGDFMRTSEIATRMMGVITKPDGVLTHDDRLRMIDLACNQDLELGLGWHAVRNLDHEAADRSPENRDWEEKNFFLNSVWSRLPKKDLGIRSLRQKLCQYLFECIKRELPHLIKEMTDQLISTRRSLDQLGRVRKNAKDCLWYLGEITRNMHQLISAASDGIYDDPKLTDFFSKGDFTKLRNFITVRSDTFNHAIRSIGKTFCVTTNGSEKESVAQVTTSISMAPVFQPPYYSLRPDEGPYVIGLNTYCELLSTAMAQNRGKNLPDIPNYRDIQAVFRSQSIRWNSLATEHVELCFEDVLKFMSEAILHVAGKHTSSRLLERYIRPSLETRRAALIEKLDELLWPFTRCHPMTAHPEYVSMPRLLSAPSEVAQFSADAGGTEWTRNAMRNRFAVELLHAAHVLDRAEAYYEIALDTFIDNVTALAIERVLLNDLTEVVLASCEPSDLSDEELESVAGEAAEVKEQRDTATVKAAALESVLRTCRQYKGIDLSTPPEITTQDTPYPEQAVKDNSNNPSWSARAEALRRKAAQAATAKSNATTAPGSAHSHPLDTMHPPSTNSSSASASNGSRSNGGSGTDRSSTSRGSPGKHHDVPLSSLAYRSVLDDEKRPKT